MQRKKIFSQSWVEKKIFVLTKNLHKTLCTTMVYTYPNFKGKLVIVPEKPISEKKIFNWYRNFGSPRLLVMLQIYTFPVQKLTW